MNIRNEIERLRAELDEASRAEGAASMTKWTGKPLADLLERNYSAQAHHGRKYARLDIGHSGAFMVDLTIGTVYGIRGYGVRHPQVIHGQVDRITGAQLLPRRFARAHTPPIEGAALGMV